MPDVEFVLNLALFFYAGNYKYWMYMYNSRLCMHIVGMYTAESIHCIHLTVLTCQEFIHRILDCNILGNDYVR